MKVSIVGTGYVGLVTGVCLAEKEHHVICVDVDPAKVDQINRALPPIHEHGLEELLKKNIHANLQATTDLRWAVASTDVSMIAVGTPSGKRGIDLGSIREVSGEVGKALKEKDTYHLVVVKSTVVPGTTDEIVRPILEKCSGKQAGRDFGLGMNPEFLTEGQAVADFMFPDRLVFGGTDEKSIQVLEHLYAAFPAVPRMRTNNKTAEMIKYTSNALLATLISFSNEMGNLCSALGDIDAIDVMRGLHLSNYLSFPLPDGGRQMAPITSFLSPGCGYGGSCLPKDVKALVAHGQRAGSPMPLLEAVDRINERQPHQILQRLQRHFPSLKGIPIAILGLSFRPDTSDMRESPAIPILLELLGQGARIKAYDPVANHEAKKLLGDSEILFCDDMIQAVKDVQVIVLVTRWEEFKELPGLISNQAPQPLVMDGRRLLDKDKVSRYEGIGL